ncbi:MAG TPA: PilZ domain-containing protein [Candidatus Acidoferrales bacterium]|nr:PilZ domain-containing protein [Candidatus Acidoferrales bacterium]
MFAPQSVERRRSSRADTYVPLFVYGYTSEREPFHEDTNSLEVSENGGLLRLDAPVRGGQKLLLHNKVSDQELECRVVRVEKLLKRTYVGVTFEEQESGFWQCRRKSAQHA